jgi:hypothetical protein
MKWLLFSDLCPLALVCFCLGPLSSPTVFALVASRACSCLFHLMRDDFRRPHLINLDFIGLSCMILASLDACDRVRCAHRAEYAWFVLALWGLILGVFGHGLCCSLRPASVRIVLGFALLGQYPTAYAVWTGHQHALCLVSSAVVFGVGYFVIEPCVGHVWWHWAASIGQALLLF